LLAGASYVHAVEIDPVIYGWGRDRHPNHPYTSPKVDVTIDDARAFFRRHEGRYDIIWFGLLDSHTSPSAYTNVRLDHFIYTRESFADMKRLLSPDGVVVLYFWAQTPWITDRLTGLLAETFGAPPLTATFNPPTPCLGWGGLMLITGSPQTLQRIAARAAAAGPLDPPLEVSERFTNPTRLTTDDWPYLYLRAPSIPTYHLVVAIAALFIGLALRRHLFRPGEALEMPMLLLGAGFMLLEVAGVSRAALLFGTTWTVNAYVIAAILSMTLLANYIASRGKVNPLGWPFAGLAIAIVALALVPISWLAELPIAARIAVGGAFLALPVLFSGFIFVTLWARSPRKDLAIGSNLLGALVGGIASMLTMLLGFRALTFLTLAVYTDGALTSHGARRPHRHRTRSAVDSVRSRCPPERHARHASVGAGCLRSNARETHPPIGAMLSRRMRTSPPSGILRVTTLPSRVSVMLFPCSRSAHASWQWKNISTSCPPCISSVSSMWIRRARLSSSMRRRCITGSASAVYPSCHPSNRSRSAFVDHVAQPARALRSHMKLPPCCDWSWPSMRRVLCAAVPRKYERQSDSV
jgi:hypothetical protein